MSLIQCEKKFQQYSAICLLLFLVVNIRLQKVKVKDEILSDYEEPSSPGFNDTGPLGPPSPSNDDPDYNMDDDDANDDDEYVPGSEYSIQFC